MKNKLALSLVFLFLILLSLGIIQACGTITSDYTLTEDLSGSGNCLTIGSNNIVIDCDGYTISGDGTGHGILIYETDGIIIKNCKVENFETGISIWHSKDNIIENNTASQNVNDGIKIFNSSSDQVINNTCIANNAGIWLTTEIGGLIKDNNCSGNYETGIKISDLSQNNIIDTNKLNNNSFQGFWITNSSGNNITGNEANNNSATGIKLNSSSYENYVYDNMVKNNIFGILLYHAYDNLIIENTATNNILPGIYLVNASGNIIDGNNFSDNGGSGIKLGELEINGSSNNTIINNIAKNNYLGLWLRSSNYNTISNNDFNLNNLTGALFTESSSNNIISNNDFNENGRGILITEFSLNNNISQNTIENNDNLGMFFGSSDYNNLTNNTISNNQEGIQMFNSSNSYIINNIISSNIESGIFPYLASNYNLFLGNLVTLNDIGIRMASINNNLTRNNVTGNNIGVNVEFHTEIGLYNNFYGNINYDFYNNKTIAISVQYVWWGTTETSEIDNKIYDDADDSSLGLVLYSPILIRPYSPTDWDNDGISNENDNCHTEPLEQVGLNGCMVDVSEDITASEGGTVENEEGTVSIDIQAGDLSADATINIEAIVNTTNYSYAVQNNSEIQGYIYNLSSTESFTNNIKIIFTYLDPGGLTIEEELFAFDIYYYNGFDWVAQNAAQDTDADTLTILTDHFSIFSIIIKCLPTINWLPPLSLDEFSIQLGATLPIKFEVRDCSGFVIDPSIEVIVKNETLGIENIFVYGDESENVRLNGVEKFYIANFQTKDIPEGIYQIYVSADGIIESISVEILKLSSETKGKAIGKDK